MASYQARGRDPLLDQNTQAALERRGKELMGIVLLLVAVLLAATLWSYSPDDPSWLAATEEPARNWLGRGGAAVASTLMVIVGLGGWVAALVPLAWGWRLLTHRGEDRALGRLIFAPIAAALASVYASTHAGGAGWPHSFGLGGLFGDTLLGAVLGVLPVDPALGLKLASFGLGLAALAAVLFVTGFDRAELRATLRFLAFGSLRTYDALLSLAGRGARAGLQGARDLQERGKARKAEAAQAAPVLRAGPRPAYATPVADPAPSLLGRVAGLMRKAVVPDPQPELIESHPPAWDGSAPSEDRIRSRIADAVRQRTGADLDLARAEPPVTKAPLRVARAPLPAEEVTPDPDDFEETEAWQETPSTDVDLDRNAFADLGDRPMTAAAGEQRRVVHHASRKSAPSSRAIAEAQPRLDFGHVGTEYELPPLSLLAAPSTVTRHALSDAALEENARMLESVLDDYGVKGEIVSVRPGPVVTMYELEPAPGLKASRVIGLADDIARSMSALSARVSTVPGRSVIGIELPNAYREKVVLREILAARDYGDGNHRLPLALGKDIGGDPVVANLAKMPHLLIAGTTGSGKSVAINTMILSLLYKLTPEECRLIMIDPKMLELSVYDGIPHLLSPVVTDPKKAVVALKWVVGEMEERYRKMSKMGVRNIEGYNGRVREALAKGELFKRTVQTGFDEDTGDPVFETEEILPVALPYIVVIVDEMADLMMVAGKEIEACIQRLAQMARASGIHLIMATQRPSVDVITGTIKANFPTRISFQVTSKIDSRTILGEMGAEQLLGQGDMLYMAGGGRVSRIHGPFVSDEEVEEIVTHLKSFGPPEYMSGVVEGHDEDREADIDAVLGLGGDSGEDALYDQAVAIVARDRKCSTSYIQRKLGIGYNKAARLVEQMEDQGVVTPANHVGKREILVEER